MTHSKEFEDAKYRKGKSGNPGGARPKSAQIPYIPALSDHDSKILELGRRVVRQKDGTFTTYIEAALHRISVAALSNKSEIDRNNSQSHGRADLKALEIFIGAYRQASAIDALRNQIMITEAMIGKHEVGEHFDQQLRRGQRPPDMVPHPDHVIVDDDMVVVCGPMSREARAAWEVLKSWIRRDAAWQHRVEAKLKVDPSNADLLEELACAKKARRALMRKVPKGWNWKERIWTLDADPVSIADNSMILTGATLDAEGRDQLIQSIRRDL